MIIAFGRFVYPVRRVPACAVWSLARVACSCGHVPPCCGSRTRRHAPYPTRRSLRLMLGQR